MKSILIFSILGLVAVARANAKERSETVEECARELNIKDVERFHKGIDLHEYMLNPTDDVTCMLACDLRKAAHANGTTLYKNLLQVVKKAYELDFETIEFTREDVESKIDDCFVKEREECEFFKCVEPFSSPFADVFVYDFILAIASGFAKALTPSIDS